MERERGAVTLRVMITEARDKLRLMLLGMEIKRIRTVMHLSVIVATSIILDGVV